MNRFILLFFIMFPGLVAATNNTPNFDEKLAKGADLFLAHKAKKSLKNQVSGKSYVAIIRFGDEIATEGGLKLWPKDHSDFVINLNISGTKISYPEECEGKKICFLKDIPQAKEYYVEATYKGKSLGDGKPKGFIKKLYADAKRKINGTALVETTPCKLNTKCKLMLNKHVQGELWIRPERNGKCIFPGKDDDYYIDASLMMLEKTKRSDKITRFLPYINDSVLKEAINGPDYTEINIVLEAVNLAMKRYTEAPAKIVSGKAKRAVSQSIGQLTSDFQEEFNKQLKQLTRNVIKLDRRPYFTDVIVAMPSSYQCKQSSKD